MYSKIEWGNGVAHINITQDGARNTCVDISGHVDSGDLEPKVVVDVDKLFAEPGYKITKVRVEDVEYFVKPGLFVEVLWQGSEDEHITCFEITGKGRAGYNGLGGKQNPHPNGTGNLMLATNGHTGGKKTFSMQLELVKQFS